MRKYYFILFVVLFNTSGKAQIINFPDANLKTTLLQSSPANQIAKNLSGAYFTIDANNDNEIDVIEAQAVRDLTIQDRNISNLEGLTYFVNLRTLVASYNAFTHVDVSSFLFMDTLEVASCWNLTHLNVKNGLLEFSIPSPPPAPMGMGGVNFFNSPNMQYVCCDEDKISGGLAYLLNYNFTNVTLNSYCTFNPGGVFYALQGNSKLDLNANGCDTGDDTFPNLKLNINDGALNSYYLNYATADYYISLPSGNYTITPILNNPTYFQISPASYTASFPADVSPLTQNFCITPLGNHPDLEVTLLPYTNARPGFDAKYKIVYKNKGNQVQSGTVNFEFDDAVLDFVTATTLPDSQTSGSLNWNFINLSPFESREFVVTLNVNSPVETPPVVIGSILNYGVSITSADIDETPADNSFEFHQTIVGSMDPNDKTCLEGLTIPIEMVGKEVHYMIRFENTGTANAENVVVKDIIDTTKFDITSLVAIAGSHAFKTKISDSNKVEFIFENINLPFDDANNDGYVAFKIKTKPTLTMGESFSNEANIYFDYNAPILTNQVVTTIAALSHPDFVFDSYFKIYPNPASTLLHIDAKKEITITSISIYNALGQLVRVISNAKQTKSIDVSELKTGNYFLKINSDKGSSNTKFIKI